MNTTFYDEYLDRKHLLGELWMAAAFMQMFGIDYADREAVYEY